VKIQPDDAESSSTRSSPRAASGRSPAHHIERRTPSIRSTRHDLALALVILVGIIAISAVIAPAGMLVFEKLLPVLTFVLGHFFQQH